MESQKKMYIVCERPGNLARVTRLVCGFSNFTSAESYVATSSFLSTNPENWFRQVLVDKQVCGSDVKAVWWRVETGGGAGLYVEILEVPSAE